MQIFDQRPHQLLSGVPPRRGLDPDETALDREDRIHARDRLQRDRRDLLGDRSAFLRLGLDVGQFEGRCCTYQ